MNSLASLIAVNLKMFWREPGTLFWAVLFPILMAWVLGIAFTTEKETIYNVHVLSEKGKIAQFKTLPDTLMAGEKIGPVTKIVVHYSNKEQAYTALKKGYTEVIIEEVNDRLVFHYDKGNPRAVSAYLLLERELQGKTRPAAEWKVAAISTVGNRYVDFLIPGLIALGIMNSCIWGISWTLIDLRMKKLLRRMVATPMKKPVFILSHFISRVILSSFEAVVLLLFAYFYFDITIQGSFLGLLVVYLAGVFAFSGIALCAGSRTSSSQVGNGLINAATLPMMILSGIFFSYQNFPEWAIPLIKVLPLTLLADSIRGIFTEGFGFAAILFPSAVLLFTGVAFTVAGLKIFKWY